MNENRKKNADLIVGLAILGSSMTGITSLVAAIFPFLNGDFVGAGVFLLAAALAFGLLANAVLK